MSNLVNYNCPQCNGLGKFHNGFNYEICETCKGKGQLTFNHELYKQLINNMENQVKEQEIRTKVNCKVVEGYIILALPEVAADLENSPVILDKKVKDNIKNARLRDMKESIAYEVIGISEQENEYNLGDMVFLNPDREFFPVYKVGDDQFIIISRFEIIGKKLV